MQVQANFYEVSNMDYDMEQANASDGDIPSAVFHAMAGMEVCLGTEICLGPSRR
jgi:hypothetical protein